jgi:hypothetical protein
MHALTLARTHARTHAKTDHACCAHAAARPAHGHAPLENHAQNVDCTNASYTDAISMVDTLPLNISGIVGAWSHGIFVKTQTSWLLA